MNTTSRKPDSVSSVNITPLAPRSARTIFMHADRERHLEVVEALVDAVGDGAVGEQRGVAAPHRVEQHRLAADVQEGLVLAGEAGGRQILGGRGTAHRDRQVVAVFAPAACAMPSRSSASMRGVRPAA